MVAVLRCDSISYGGGCKMWHYQLWLRSFKRYDSDSYDGGSKMWQYDALMTVAIFGEWRWDASMTVPSIVQECKFILFKQLWFTLYVLVEGKHLTDNIITLYQCKMWDGRSYFRSCRFVHFFLNSGYIKLKLSLSLSHCWNIVCHAGHVSHSQVV
jgi:hypothetical protein